jgi:branched-chain amino acid transport system substrate-binding protein
LSGDQKAFRDALQNLKLDTPTGPVTLDKNRNGIAYNFLTEVAKADDGHLYNKVVKVVENVNQTLGMNEDEFMKLGPVSRDNPSCP